jgi:hypothetical protein
MNGAISDDRMLQYHDQIEQVVGFCDRNAVESGKRVALLDDRNNGGYDRSICGYTCEERGDRRPYLGPLTAQELNAELSKEVTYPTIYGNGRS